jgi:DNA mismatch endonuclease, patch repair protein
MRCRLCWVTRQHSRCSRHSDCAVAGAGRAMADTLTKTERSDRMRSVKQRSTALELLVRKGLHKRGLRYVLGGRRLPGSPDLTFPSRKAVVFVHGCFWHAHSCRLGRRPSSNTRFWDQKAIANKARDARKEAELRAIGWTVFTVWQCELHAQRCEATLDRLAEAIRAVDA